MIARILLFFTALIVSACNVTYTPKLVQHIKGSSFAPTEKGYYTAELVMRAARPVTGMNEAFLIVHDYEAVDIPGLQVTVTPRLPGATAEPEGSPSVRDAGRGLYIIENIHFPIPGKWEIALRIAGPNMTDTVTLSIAEVIEDPTGCCGCFEAVTPPGKGESVIPLPGE